MLAVILRNLLIDYSKKLLADTNIKDKALTQNPGW